MNEKYSNPVELLEFLGDNGFGQIKDGSKVKHFQNNDGILKKLDLDDIKRWILESIRKDNNLEEGEKKTLSESTLNLSKSKLQNWLVDLPVYSEDKKDGCRELPILRDSKHTCYVPFHNGVVVISKDDLSLKTYDQIKDQGSVWSSSIRNQVINVNHLPSVSNDLPISLQIEGCYSEFIKKSMIKDGRPEEKYHSSLFSLESSLGYLCHRYNNPQIMKNIVFIDSVLSTGGLAQGGNGKSLALKGLRYVRNLEIQDGRMFRGSSCSGSRFNFSLVTRDTDIIIIDDINPKFDPSQIFSVTTEDMTVEGKGTNKFIIPFDVKPKISITSNYYLNGSGNSFERRRHIVEFGDYWSNNPKTIEEEIGKLLFDEFDDDDWNQFYHFIFFCIQRWLEHGLVDMDLSHLKNRNLIIEVEGSTGDGTVVEWINNHLDTRRLGRYDDKNGISIDEFYNDFEQELSGDSETLKSWDVKKLQKGLFRIVQERTDLDYNPHKSHRGSSMSDRRYLVGPKGNQKEHIVVGDVSTGNEVIR